MNHIDITFDFETVATTANAAPMQLAAVAWDRSAVSHARLIISEFHAGVDLRSCAINGYDFDQATIDWWSRQKDEPKNALMEEKTERVGEVVRRFFRWIDEVKETQQAKTVCLWCQGTDFDIPILKNICRKEGIAVPIRYEYFCDARTFVLQNALFLVTDTMAEEYIKYPRKVYDWIMPVPASFGCGAQVHSALFDCRRTTWNVWNVMQKIRSITPPY